MFGAFRRLPRENSLTGVLQPMQVLAWEPEQVQVGVLDSVEHSKEVQQSRRFGRTRFLSFSSVLCGLRNRFSVRSRMFDQDINLELVFSFEDELN